MVDVCCWSNCENPAGGGTHTMIDVPQIGGEPMRATLPVCEDHWYGNWHSELRRLSDEVGRLTYENKLLRQQRHAERATIQGLRRLAAELFPEPSDDAAQPGADSTEGDGRG